ncbi:MAG: hypothetical protein KJZ54_03055 [Phycisphaerales bacterium]|nr:hypothetical protein [Phycisphaerales bacterium]
MVATMLPSLLAGTASGAVSPEAQYIRQESEEAWRAFRESVTFGLEDLFADLWRLTNECARPGWDGYEAEPISPGSIDHAARLLRALPLGTPRPSVGAEPDGQVTLEWYSSPRRVLSVSVSPDGNLHYAALLGAVQQYGTEPFFGDLPAAILDLIRRVGRA